MTTIRTCRNCGGWLMNPNDACAIGIGGHQCDCPRVKPLDPIPVLQPFAFDQKPVVENQKLTDLLAVIHQIATTGRPENVPWWTRLVPGYLARMRCRWIANLTTEYHNDAVKDYSGPDRVYLDAHGDVVK